MNTNIAAIIATTAILSKTISALRCVLTTPIRTKNGTLLFCDGAEAYECTGVYCGSSSKDTSDMAID
ncbi:MAG: hypothetical protein ABIO00_01435 [Candidatus Paceibacterota bacterium]